jgi:hypothetical protein
VRGAWKERAVHFADIGIVLAWIKGVRRYVGTNSSGFAQRGRFDMPAAPHYPVATAMSMRKIE